jgi:uncharacterized protein YbjT (DUF2867 family)
LQPSTIFLAGASRGVGLEIAKRLTQSGLSVIALLRSPTAQAELEALGITVRFGDAMDIQSLQQAMGDVNISTVISTIGGKPADGDRSDFIGNRNLIDIARQSGVTRFILVTSLGTGNSATAIPPNVLEVLSPVLQEKHKAEQHLVASGLTYTIIRPGGLKSEPPTGNGVLTLDPTIGGPIHRADVADLVCQCLESDRAYNQTLSAFDLQMRYGNQEFPIFTL